MAGQSNFMRLIVNGIVVPFVKELYFRGYLLPHQKNDRTTH